MEIRIVIKAVKQENILLDATISAMKNGKSVKDTNVKNIKTESTLSEFVSEIESRFKSNITSINFNVIVDESLIKYPEFIHLLETSFNCSVAFGNLGEVDVDASYDVPAYINLVPNTIFKKCNLLIFICQYFTENPDKVFDFPLYLEMREPDETVEDFIIRIIDEMTEIHVITN